MDNIKDLENINFDTLMKVKVTEGVIKSLEGRIAKEKASNNDINRIAYYDRQIKKLELKKMELLNSMDNNFNIINEYKDDLEFGVSPKRMK